MTKPGTDTLVLNTFGGLFLLGLLSDLAGRYTPLPRVTLLLLAGTVLFEISRQVITRWTLARVGDIPKKKHRHKADS